MQVNAKHYLMLLGLGLIWGSSFPFLKVVLESMTPISAAAFRLTISALAMIVIINVFKLKIPNDWRVWRDYMVIAIIGNVVPFFLISWGEQHISAALASVLMGLIPLATMLAAHILTDDEKISMTKLVGVIVGGAGVIILIGVDALDDLGTYVWAQLAVVVAAVCYGVSSVYARRSKVTQFNPLSNAAGVLICSSLISLPFAFSFESPSELDITLRSISALLFLSLVCTCAAYFLLYNLLAQVGATFTSFNNYLVPVFGMIISVILLNDPIKSTTYIALVLIFSGLAISQQKSVTLRNPLGLDKRY
ncbi:DMT family transporter [Vibrio viridaestus]|uniref:DMT family transporter n=1 Tax=Vibrio viridaestus TaxID=2487322 RepID=A0A3N9THN8_9VIBR|nr:DMT family transporter [Vibrio viridaestus]RQW63689.1 DMT family transporter [Vibrio viridaestus]